MQSENNTKHLKPVPYFILLGNALVAFFLALYGVIDSAPNGFTIYITAGLVIPMMCLYCLPVLLFEQRGNIDIFAEQARTRQPIRVAIRKFLSDTMSSFGLYESEGVIERRAANKRSAQVTSVFAFALAFVQSYLSVDWFFAAL